MFALFAADAILAIHLAFILFVALGALLALKWRWVPWLQLPAAAWGCFVELSGRICPLTVWENALSERAGEAGYPGDFVQYYLLATIYPQGLTRGVQFVLAAGVVGVNLLVYCWLWRRRR